MAYAFVGVCSLVAATFLMSGQSMDLNEVLSAPSAAAEVQIVSLDDDDEVEEPGPCDGCQTGVNIKLEPRFPFILNPADWQLGYSAINGPISNKDGRCVAGGGCVQVTKCEGWASPLIMVMTAGYKACIPIGPCVTGPSGPFQHTKSILWKLNCNSNSTTEYGFELYDNLGNHIGDAKYRGSCSNCLTVIGFPPF
jgi:hypothetical protein